MDTPIQYSKHTKMQPRDKSWKEREGKKKRDWEQWTGKEKGEKKRKRENFV